MDWPYLCHLLFPLLFGLLCVRIVVCFNDDKFVRFLVDYKFTWSVLDWHGDLVEHGTQLL